jgi:sugar phosphate isomerase/epimerase
MKLAVSLEALGGPFRTALSSAAKLGVGGVQWNAVGELAPERLTATGRREIQQLLSTHGLSLSALACPLRRGLDDPADLEPRLARIRDVMALSFELGARLVVIEPGRLPPSDDPRADTLTESLTNLSQYGDRTGTVLALQTGLDSGKTLVEWLGRFDTGSLGASFHPANWMIHEFDPIAELPLLRGRVVYVQASDARRNRADRVAAALPLGHGDLDWLQIAGSLAGIDYRGWVAADRAGSPADIAAGVALLKRLM